MYVKPKKNIGQHFLTDDNIAFRIVESLNIQADEFVLEVGPGTGVLTKFLLQTPEIDLKVIEIDRESIEFLNLNFESLKNKIIEKSFLNLDFETLGKSKISVIGNFPYNISSQIVFKIIENRSFVEKTVGMFQKEVAKRIAANPSSKDYGIITVLTQAYFDVEYLFTVDEHVFNPPPKVKSGVLRFTNKHTKLNCDEVLFKKIVKTTFNTRRKMIRNSIKVLLGDKEINTDYLLKRPEQLSVSEFEELTNIVQEVLSQ